jgi:hypothetical protein
MGAVDGFDHLIAMNAGLRRIKRGAWQAMEHWLLRIELVNTYVIAKRATQEEPDLKSFRSQVTFRQGIIAGLLGLANAVVTVPNNVPINPKKHISYINTDEGTLHITKHHKVKITTRKIWVYCKGLRFGDRPFKRRALSEIASNHNGQSNRRTSSYGCKECQVALCS